MLASSSSIWMNIPPTNGKRAEILSAISVDGVIWYPAKNLQPAAMPPSAHLKVFATDPGSVRDFEVFARQSGNVLLDSGETDGTFYYLIEKKA